MGSSWCTSVTRVEPVVRLFDLFLPDKNALLFHIQMRDTQLLQPHGADSEGHGAKEKVKGAVRAAAGDGQNGEQQMRR